MSLYLWYCRWCALALVMSLPVMGQPSINLYWNSSSDGTNVYLTGELQYSPGQSCNMCSYAYHTYSQTLTITSPTGRNAYNTNDLGSAASNSVDMEGEAVLSVGDDLGDYTFEFRPRAICSVVGLFLAAVINPQPPITINQSYFGPPVLITYHPGGSQTCEYQSIACTVGTPTCGLPAHGLLLTFSCPLVARARFFVINGTCTFALAADGGNDAPKICN